ncbi:hypothetical protein [Leptospira santarosai]|uniref:hypothetical protein n=1 Tax=Leptospira santarosai TaxID=28183 RepID=UPI000518B157|nr:hypothetical protein [Leptospira santarosai]
MKKVALIFVVIVFQSCYWYQIGNKQVDTKSIIKNLYGNAEFSISFDYNKSSVINIDERHYKFISSFQHSFQKIGHFHQIGDRIENPKYDINIQVTVLYNIGNILRVSLSALTLSVLPLYYTHNFIFEVEIENRINSKKVTFEIPVTMKIVSNVYYRSSYTNFLKDEFIEAITKEIMLKGMDLGIFD